MSRTTPIELTPYLRQPPAMAAGAAGKRGEVVMHFEADPNGRSLLRHLYRRTPLIVQQALYFDEELPQLPCIYILSSGGPNVDGDRYRQEIRMSKGAMAHISTGAATKIAPMNYNYSELEQEFRLDEGAYLEYLPEQIIPCRSARYRSDCRISIAPSATLFYSEIYTSGRRHHNGEHFDYDLLSLSTSAKRPNGVQLFGEKMVIVPSETTPAHRWIMAEYDTFATVFILTPPSSAEAIYGHIESRRTDLSAVGVTHLPMESGLMCRVLAKGSNRAKKIVRELCSIVRREIKGRPLPAEFPWR